MNIKKNVIKNSCILFFLAYLIPFVYSYFSTDYFIYTNSWDEPTYLSYQGALSTLKTPGYFMSSWVILLLHHIGVSGAYQNLIFDFLIPISIFVLLISSLNLLGLNSASSRAYAIIIVFGSVLFNKANPFIKLISQKDFGFLVSTQQDFGFWISAMESYPSLLRTPNPQFSYLLLISFLYLYLIFRRRFLLLIPIPFLYWSVAIPYAFFVIAFLVYSIFQPRKYYWLIVINFFIMLSLGTLLSALAKILTLLSQSFSSSRLFAPFDIFLISPILVFSAAAYLSVILFYKAKSKIFPLSIQHIYISSLFCLLLMTNLQVFTKIRLDPKGLQDSSGTFIASCLLVLTIHLFSKQLANGKEFSGIILRLRRLFLLIIFVLLLSSQGFSFQNMQYKIFIGPRINKESISVIKDNSLNAIVPHIDAASRMTLLAPKLLAPPFSYQYNFPEINRLCSLNKSLMNNAQNYLKDEGEKGMLSPDFIQSAEESYSFYIQQERISEAAGYKDYDVVCSKTGHLRRDFYTLSLKKDEIWAFFPNWLYLKEML